MKSFRRGVASVQAVHWMCQPDASGRGIQVHAESLTCEVMCIHSRINAYTSSSCRGVRVRGEASRMSRTSHRWCKVSPKIDRATAVTMSRRGVRGNPTNVRTGLSTTTCTTHHYTSTSTARVGALIWSHLGDWITPVGPGSTPTVHWGRFDGRPWVAQPHEHAHATQVTDTCVEHGWRPHKPGSGVKVRTTEADNL